MNLLTPLNPSDKRENCMHNLNTKKINASAQFVNKQHVAQPNVANHTIKVLTLAVIATLIPHFSSAESVNPLSYQPVIQNTHDSQVQRQFTPQSAITDPAVSNSNEVFNGKSVNSGVDYALNKNVGKVEVEVAQNNMPADGQCSTDVTIKLFDIKGNALTQIAFVTLETSAGRILLANQASDVYGPNGGDLDKVTPGTQIKVVNGVATFKLIAPFEPQDVNLRVTAGKIHAAGVVSFVPELRDMIAVGLIEGVISKRNLSSGSITPVRTGDGFEQQIIRWSNQFNNGKANAASRAAFFIKGKIKGDVLLTAAYDSDKETRVRLLRDIRPEEFYPVYGDSSIQGFDARSSERLYVRLDKEKSYVLYGDFNTGSGFSQQFGGGAVAGLQQRNLGQYNRTATGLRGHYEKGRLFANGFVSRDSLKQVIEEYPANGTSGPYAVKNNSALENSEKVEIVIRDKNQLNRIVEIIQLARFEDYVFEPFSGRILLKSPIQALTQVGNRQSLRITYEVDQGGEEFWVSGVDGQVKISDNLEIGAAWIEDRNPDAKYRLQSVNGALKLGANAGLVAEVARSQSIQYQAGNSIFATPSGLIGESQFSLDGNAYRIEFATQSDKDAIRQWSGKAWWAKADENFDNNASGYTRGKGESGVSGNLQLSENIAVFGEAIQSEDKLVDAKRSGANLGINAKLSPKLSMDLSLRRIKEDSNLPLGALIGSNSAPLGALGNTGGFYGTGADQNGFASTGIASAGATNSQELDATTIALGVHYKASDKLNLDGLVELGEEDKKRLALSGQYQVAERTKLFARAETQSGLASAYSINSGDRSNAFTFGIDNTYMEGGSLFSEMRLRDAISSQQNNVRDFQLANGLRNTWNITQGLVVNTGFEYLRILQGNATDAVALTGGFDYTTQPLWKLSGRLEFRKLFDDKDSVGDTAQNQVLSTVAVARKLDRDWTLLARNYLLYTNNNENADSSERGNTLQDRLQLGAAWRPVDNNVLNGLMRYEYRTVKDQSQLAGEDYRSHIVSTHLDYHPSRPWWFTGRLAGKLTTDNTLPTDNRYNAFLLGGRGVYDISEKWDIGLIGSVLYSPQGSSKQWAAGAELGYQLQTNLWASAGYNFSGFSDDELAGSEYTAKGFFVRLRFKFDENLFASKDTDVNRTLDRDNAASLK